MTTGDDEPLDVGDVTWLQALNALITRENTRGVVSRKIMTATVCDKKDRRAPGPTVRCGPWDFVLKPLATQYRYRPVSVYIYPV